MYGLSNELDILHRPSHCLFLIIVGCRYHFPNLKNEATDPESENCLVLTFLNVRNIQKLN